MTFSLYIIEHPSVLYPMYDIEIDGSVCCTNHNNINELLLHLKSDYTGKVESLLLNPSTVYSLRSCYSDTIYTITHLCTIEYADAGTFFSNFLTDLKLSFPELLL